MRRNALLRKRRMTAKNTAKRHTSIFFGNALSFEYGKARREKKSRRENAFIKCLRSRLVSGNYHEQKEPVVMEMASNPPCFWSHLLD